MFGFIQNFARKWEHRAAQPAKALKDMTDEELEVEICRLTVRRDRIYDACCAVVDKRDEAVAEREFRQKSRAAALNAMKEVR